MADPVTLRRAFRRIAEARIREAIAAGAFEDLPGMGKPIPDVDRPYDPMWWVKSWLARERRAGDGRRREARYRGVAAIEELRQASLDGG